MRLHAQSTDSLITPRTFVRPDVDRLCDDQVYPEAFRVGHLVVFHPGGAHLYGALHLVAHCLTALPLNPQLFFLWETVTENRIPTSGLFQTCDLRLKELCALWHKYERASIAIADEKNHTTRND